MKKSFSPNNNIDLTCNIENIPIRDDSVDIILNIDVLEYVKDPFKIVKEMKRI